MNNSLARCLILLFACLFCLSVSSQAYKATKVPVSKSAQAYRDAKKKAGNPAQAYRDAKKKATAAPARQSSKQSRAVAQKSSTQPTENVAGAVEKDCRYPQKVYLLGKALEGGPNSGSCDEQGNNCRVNDYIYESVGKAEFQLMVDPYVRNQYNEEITDLHVSDDGDSSLVFSTYAKRGQVPYIIKLRAYPQDTWQIEVMFYREDGVDFWVVMEKEADTINLDMLSKLIDDIHRTRQQLPGVRQFPQSDSCRAKLAEFMNSK